MTDLKESAMPEQRPRGLQQTLRTYPATEETVRNLIRTLAVAMGRTPTQDEVIGAAVAVAGAHIPLMVEYIQKGARS